MNVMYNIRQTISAEITRRHLTHKEFARSAGIPFRTLESILYGSSTNPTIKTLICISQALDVSLEEMCYGRHHKTVKNK